MIHRFWTGPAEPPLEPWVSHVLRQQDHEVRDWTEADLPPKVRWTADAAEGKVRSKDTFRHRSNVVRLGLLQQFGGYWADHDLIPLVPFSELPFPVVATHRDGRCCNCFMGFPAGHPVLEAALEEISRAPLSTENYSVEVSGEVLINSLLTSDIHKIMLYIDSDGKTNPGSTAWGIHCHTSSINPLVNR